MNILVVEDDSVISTFVSDGLKEHGFGVTQCQSAEEALDEVVVEPFDLAIVDIMLPGMNGLDLVKSLRGQGVTFPILFLSARKTVDDKVSGLRIGGDDYLTKPFSFNELLARVEVLLRRNQSAQTVVSEKLSFHSLSFDLSRKLAWRGERKLSLQPREMVLLEFFLRNRERVISRTQIMEHVWDYQFDPQTNVVDVLVCRLRSKIDKDEPIKLLHTIRGMGYVLRAGE
ncbi:MAG: response regulator transcription factor [Endozoicomonas sp.]|uniref:response regulator transcription factor n=1 Tax=Endozoicomonas sp. TaxID=1892382 RepID=UPI003D9BCC05